MSSLLWSPSMSRTLVRLFHVVSGGHPSLSAVLPSVLAQITSSDFCLRHGALHAVAEVSHALCEVARSNGQSFSDYVGTAIVQGLLEVGSKVSTPLVSNDLTLPPSIVTDCQSVQRSNRGNDEASW